MTSARERLLAPAMDRPFGGTTPAPLPRDSAPAPDPALPTIDATAPRQRPSTGSGAHSPATPHATVRALRAAAAIPGTSASHTRSIRRIENPPVSFCRWTFAVV